MSLWSAGVQYGYSKKLYQINSVQLHYAEFITNYAKNHNFLKFNQSLSAWYDLL